MAWIFVDREKDGHDDEMRSQMRRNMRSGGGVMYRTYGGGSMREHYNEGYRMGYKHGWEDHSDDEDESFRRQRDSRGRFV